MPFLAAPLIFTAGAVDWRQMAQQSALVVTTAQAANALQRDIYMQNRADALGAMGYPLLARAIGVQRHERTEAIARWGFGGWGR